MVVDKIARRLKQVAILTFFVKQDNYANRISTHLLLLLPYVINTKAVSDRKVFQYRLKLPSIIKQKICLFFRQMA